MVVNHSRQSNWSLLPTSFLKCNLDDSFSAQYNRVGIGICILEMSWACFWGTKTIWLEPVISICEGETKALLAAIFVGSKSLVLIELFSQCYYSSLSLPS